MPERIRAQWLHDVAMAAALRLQRELEPYCERIAIAGSLRRQKPTVGDIELLCVSRITPFEEVRLDLAIEGMLDVGDLAYRWSAKGVRVFGKLNKLLVDVPSGIPLDVFSATNENWGMALVVRTGPKEFNVRLMSRFKALGMRGHAYGGVTSSSGEEIACPDEETVFRLLGWQFQAPEERG